MKRTLTLRRENLADLTPAELTAVDGGTVTRVTEVQQIVDQVVSASQLRCAISLSGCIATC